MDVLRAKFNSYRRPEFQTATLLVEDAGAKRIVKKPLSIAAIPHVLGLADKCDRLQKYHAGFRVLSPLLEAGAGVFEFDPNGSLETRLASKMADGDKDGCLRDLEEFAAAVGGPAAEADGWWSVPEFVEVFGEVASAVQRPLPCLNPANVDLAFSNVHLPPGEQTPYTMLDCEWTFDFAVPVQYVLWRALARFLASHTQPANERWPVEDLYSPLGVEAGDVPGFTGMEAAFQRYVYGPTTLYGVPERMVLEKRWSNFDEVAAWIDPDTGEAAR
ncbi:MAG: hypothetical protein IIC73_09005, partial [Armatimonadetes bacterium]|nr:hypothetical protein [Armatimonadota bacterium]